MNAFFHFLRPWWLVALLPLLFLFTILWRQKPRLKAWEAVCDLHLLQHLMSLKGKGKSVWTLLCLFLSMFFIIISLAGPTWTRLPVPGYLPMQPKVIVLDLSETMLAQEPTPDRLTRAKFKLHDLFQRKDIGQLGLVVYTSEPFVVSPLTEDAKTIDALLSSLTPAIMPVAGQRLETALEEAARLINNAGFFQGEILVLTGETPTEAAIRVAKNLAGKQIYTSIMPISNITNLNPLFRQLSSAGKGQLIFLNDTPKDLEQWLNGIRKAQHYKMSKDNYIPVWRDEGRWFLIPALLFLLPVFRKGWVERINA